MYEAHFGFSERPFAAAPQVEHYFPSLSAAAARERLVRCIERAEGPAMLVGPAGTGKTLICRLLAEQFRQRLSVALLPSARLGSARALLQSILYELGRPYRGMDEGELRLALVDYVTASRQCSSGLLLLVDEAHVMPLRLIEEARLLTNLGSGGQPCVRLVLAGACALEERLASPKLESLNQRIVARCYLEPFSGDETLRYIRQRIEAAGAKAEDVFPEAACQRVYQATGGVPRLVNQVCDHALLLACAAGRYTLDAALVEEAWADLQQLPVPWSGEPHAPGAGSVVEFGTLDELPEQADPTSVPLEGRRAAGPRSAIEAEDRCELSDAPPDLAGQFCSLEIGATEFPASAAFPPSAAFPATAQRDHSIHPAERLAQLEGLLAEAEADFQPAGSIGPEVELVFDEPERPFCEPFAEEEVVPARWPPRSRVAQPSLDTRPAAIAPPARDLVRAPADEGPGNLEATGELVGVAGSSRPRAQAHVRTDGAPANPARGGAVARRYGRLFTRLREVAGGWAE